MPRDQCCSGGPDPSITAAVASPGVERAPDDPGNIRIHRWCDPLIRKACHSARGVAADARQLDQLRRVGRDDAVPPGDHFTGQAVKIGGAAVVSQPFPGFPHHRRGRRGQMPNRRELLQEPGVEGLDPGHLGLLQHDLGHQDPIGVASAPPRQVASMPPVPAGQHAAEAKVSLGGSFCGHGGPRYGEPRYPLSANRYPPVADRIAQACSG